MKAYEMKVDRLWVLNVGDIKPLEYNIELFLDMAYKAEPFKERGAGLLRPPFRVRQLPRTPSRRSSQNFPSTHSGE